MNKKLPLIDTVFMEITKPVSTLSVFRKGLWRSLFRAQGVLSHKEPKKIKASMKGVQPDPEKVNLYRRICGYPPDDNSLPILFPETLFIHSLGTLVTSRAFPLSPIGLIHMGQEVRQIKPIPQTSSLDLCCEISELFETERGIQLVISFEVTVGGEVVWKGLGNFLSRFRSTIKGKRPKKRSNEPDKSAKKQETIMIPGDTGLRYAKASGDYNPHHLYGITAKPLGYKRPIAHGMWSLARSLAEIEKHIPATFPCSVDSSFKVPIYMPATVLLDWEHQQDNRKVLFQMKDAKKNLPHLYGTLAVGTV